MRGVKGSAAEGVCFRLSFDADENPSLAIDAPMPGDRKFQYKKSTVLVMSDTVAERSAGRVLDVNAAGDFVLM